jgi:F0F1-type ATP synthase assembly protein I
VAKKNRSFSFARSARSFQDNVARSGPVAGASYTGYAVDRWQGTEPWFLVAGLALGIIVGFYELVKTAWRR